MRMARAARPQRRCTSWCCEGSQGQATTLGLSLNPGAWPRGWSTRTDTSGNSSPLNRSEEHTSELQSHSDLVCRLLLEKKNQDSRKILSKKTGNLFRTTTMCS